MLCLSNTKRHTRVHLRCAQWVGSIIREAWPVPAVETTLPLSSPSDQAHFWTPVTFTKTTQCQVPCFDKEEPCSGKHLTTLIIDIVCLSQSLIKKRFSRKKKNGILSDRIIFVNYAVIQRVEEITNHFWGWPPLPLFTTCHDKGRIYIYIILSCFNLFWGTCIYLMLGQDKLG